jgi:mono/diheme cytochrome c family protein
MTPLLVEGKAIFASHKCSSCHGAEGIGGSRAAPALANAGATLPPDLLMTLLRRPTGRMRKGGMPTVSVNDEQLKALAAYISYISGNPAQGLSENGARLASAGSSQALARQH